MYTPDHEHSSSWEAFSIGWPVCLQEGCVGQGEVKEPGQEEKGDAHPGNRTRRREWCHRRQRLKSFTKIRLF